MKLLLSTLLATGLATTAIAGNSDRYNDLRLDTAVGHVTDVAKTTKVASSKSAAPTNVVLSTRNSAKSGGYAYINPYGIGPSNDSR